MIVGIGIDVVEVARIERAMQNPRFVRRILCEEERAEGLSAGRVAGRWAAKEALAKALGRSLRWHQVCVANDDYGRPTLRVEGVAELAGCRVHLTITHERSVAAAVVVIERG